MTKLIVDKGENFSLWEFYAARARRIIPALFVLCAILAVFGSFMLPSLDYQMLGGHIAASIAFVSNFIYKGEAGYFDAPARYKWVLHTWSLSVEWQFYLLYPLVIMAVKKICPRRTMTAALALTLLSLLAAAVWSHSEPSWAFYLLPSRSWELTAGGLVYFYQGRNKRPWPPEYIGYSGLLLIAASAFFFTADAPWPFWGALAPVAGAVVILAACQSSRAFWIDNAAAQALGRWSYSIYLWHWPLAVALGYWSEPRGIVFNIGALFLAIFLGWLSYRLIEQPARKIGGNKTGRILFYAVLAMAVMAASGLLIAGEKGFPARMVSRPMAQRAEKGAEPGYCPQAQQGKACGFDRHRKILTPCLMGNEKNIRYVILGDSHAESLADAVMAAAGKKSGGALLSHQCATIFNSELKNKERNNGCAIFNQQALDYIESTPKDTIVVVINRYAVNVYGPNEGLHKPFGILYSDIDDKTAAHDPYETYREKLSDSLCRLQAVRKTCAVLPMPEMTIDIPRFLARQAMFGDRPRDIGIPISAYRARNEVPIQALERAREKCGLTLLDPTPYLCPDGICRGTIHGRPLYRDSNHINGEGRRRLMPLLQKLFDARRTEK
jgi:peptidoglycan/LPS O-acetylase OafA/YrhL